MAHAAEQMSREQRYYFADIDFGPPRLDARLCEVCGSESCEEPHRFFTKEGFVCMLTELSHHTDSPDVDLVVAMERADQAFGTSSRSTGGDARFDGGGRSRGDDDPRGGMHFDPRSGRYVPRDSNRGYDAYEPRYREPSGGHSRRRDPGYDTYDPRNRAPPRAPSPPRHRYDDDDDRYGGRRGPDPDYDGRSSRRDERSGRSGGRRRSPSRRRQRNDSCSQM